MFPNLDAEQARNWHCNRCVAERLNLSQKAYENKKKTGNFKLKEMELLLELYEAPFEYLFALEDKYDTAT